MEELKREIVKEFESYWINEDKVINNNKEYLDSNKYSGEFIEKKKIEIEKSKETFRNISRRNFERLEEKYIKSLKVDTETIDSIEYQTKLSNILKIIEMKEGNISKDKLQFMINARDSDTLSVLRSKYETIGLREAFEESNIENIKYKIQELIYYAKMNLNDFMGRPRSRSAVLAEFR